MPRRLVLLGHPVAHSLSPRFQNAALSRAGIDLRYEAIDVAPDALEAIFAALIQQGAAGNVTIPHKAGVFALCKTVTAVARRTGAVNTFWTDAHGDAMGDNTDVSGFDTACRGLVGEIPVGMRVALLGAGGAASAVLAAIEGWDDGRALVVARSPERAHALCTRFDTVAEMAASADEAVATADLVVNATPVGMRDDAHPVSLSGVSPTAAILDLVYRPGETSWVRAARARGHRASDGLTMLIEQGALAFERWFGAAPDRDAMWSAVGR